MRFTVFADRVREARAAVFVVCIHSAAVAVARQADVARHAAHGSGGVLVFEPAAPGKNDRNQPGSRVMASSLAP